MPEYICECCDFKTMDKTRYAKHLETLKHKKLINSMDGEDKQLALTNENTVLKEEIKSLKLKLEVYKEVIKELGVKLQTEHSDEETQYYDFDPSKFLEEVDIDVSNELLIEEIAALRTSDDLVTKVTVDNAFEAFFHNERNNLPFLKDYLEMIENPLHLGDLIISKVLDECSFKVTDKYKHKYKLYKDGWLKPSKSAELLEQLIFDVWVNIKCYNKLWLYYYGYDSNLRTMDRSKWVDLDYKIKDINNRIRLDKPKIIKYICEKMLE